MKVVIEIGYKFLVLPLETAGVLTQLLANGVVYERDGYSSPMAYKRTTDEGLKITFAEDDLFEPEDAKVAQLKKERDEANTARYTQSTKQSALEKQVAELTAQLKAIKSVTTCTVAHPEETQAKAWNGEYE